MLREQFARTLQSPGFEDRRADRRACSDFGWLLLLADDHLNPLSYDWVPVCTDWVCRGDRRVCHLVDHFIYRPHTIASITSCTECSADQADHLTSRINRQ